MIRKLSTLEDVHGFSNIFLSNGRVPQQGEHDGINQLSGNTLISNWIYGTNPDYLQRRNRGEIADKPCVFLKAVGKRPITLRDMRTKWCEIKLFLSITSSGFKLFNSAAYSSCPPSEF